MLLWIGIILYGLLDGVANRMRVRRRKICLSEISAWNRKHGIESEALPIHANNGETYCIISIDNGKQIAVNIDCRPTKQGYYKCVWVWNDPKDGEHYFLTPNNYKILFCFDTGNIEEDMGTIPHKTQSTVGDTPHQLSRQLLANRGGNVEKTYDIAGTLPAKRSRL